MAKLQLISLLAITSLLILGCEDTPRASDSTVVTIESGQLRGFEYNHNTAAWLGIPYAAPPVGELRWRAPRVAPPWEGLRDALHYGPACTQPLNFTAGENAPEAEHSIGVEDCLTLNVYAPADAHNADVMRPVMFWIHGGGNVVGSSQVYDAALLASSQDVVVVSINYRLGLMGWFRHWSLRGADTSAADRSGNFGTLDIIAALHWVQNNIDAFGGDPGNVTVFGESAGGRNTWSMVQSPLASGLFHRAIIQSGTLKTMNPIKAETHVSTAPDYPQYQNNASEIVSRLVETPTELPAQDLADRLRQLSADALYSAVTLQPQGMYKQPKLFLDGYVFVAPALELFKDPASYNAVPIITGTNRDEDKLFMQFDERWVDFKFGFIPEPKDTDRYNKAAAYGADTWRALSVDKPAEIISRNGGAPVYTYRFDFDDLTSWPANFSVLAGAAHALEIPFVFGSEGNFPWNLLFSNSAQRQKLSAAMMDYWGAFAHHGNPGKGSSGGFPQWSAWQESGTNILLLDTDNDGGVRMSDNRMSLAMIKDRMREDDAFTQEEKCEAYRLVFLNGYQIPLGYDAAEYATFGDGGCD